MRAHNLLIALFGLIAVSVAVIAECRADDKPYLEIIALGDKGDPYPVFRLIEGSAPDATMTAQLCDINHKNCITDANVTGNITKFNINSNVNKLMHAGVLPQIFNFGVAFATGIGTFVASTVVVSRSDAIGSFIGSDISKVFSFFEKDAAKQDIAKDLAKEQKVATEVAEDKISAQVGDQKIAADKAKAAAVTKKSLGSKAAGAGVVGVLTVGAFGVPLANDVQTYVGLDDPSNVTPIARRFQTKKYLKKPIESGCLYLPDVGATSVRAMMESLLNVIPSAPSNGTQTPPAGKS